MCGICGFVYRDRERPVDEAVVRAMLSKLVRRGPDEEGTFLGAGGKRVAMGTRRLAVIDVAGGRQPMTSADGNFTIVFNGEIFNFRELRAECESRGRTFRTHSDTEVILALFEGERERTPAHLNGQFAFAAWDERAGELLLARDRLGEKPLFYHHAPDCFAFASSLESLLEAPGIARTIDPEALELYLTLGYVPAPRTIFKGVSKLSPGATLTLRDGQLTEKRYWSPAFGPVEPLRNEAAASEELRRLLADSVRMRLIADVPLGAFLSGGIDSSIIVALMAGETKEPVRTFAIGFDDALYNELGYARKVADRNHTEHREFLVEPKSAEVIPQLVESFGEPFADSSAIPTWYLSRETRAHVKVALSGDGGDELFGGYDRYRAMRLAASVDRSPRFLRRTLAVIARRMVRESGEQRSRANRAARFFSALERDPVERYLAWMSLFDAGSRDVLTTETFRTGLGDFRGEDYLREAFARNARTSSTAQRAMTVDVETYLPGDLLTKTDVASMSWGLEVRCPFLDHRLVELARNIPVEWKLSMLRGKEILRYAFRDKLPRSVRKRKKMGFGVPLGAWFRGELKGMLEDTLLAPGALSRDVLRGDAVRALIDEHQSGRNDHSARLYALLFLELWWQRYHAIAKPET
jgi:asparagine synthase (glutamine-hydrolysing)